jgi:CHAD domain-containing protein
MREYARQQTGILLRRFAFQVSRAAKSGNADAIHDLRVSIRRLSRCLRLFSQFYPDKSWKRIRRQVEGIMKLAGTVRDCDITLEALAAAGVPHQAAIVSELGRERAAAGRELLHELERLASRNFSRKWRERLGL